MKSNRMKADFSLRSVFLHFVPFIRLEACTVHPLVLRYLSQVKSTTLGLDT